MKIIKEKYWREPLNDSLYFACYKYTIDVNGRLYYYSKIKGEFEWYADDQVNPSHGKDRIWNTKELDKQFKIVHRNYLRVKKLERVLNVEN